MKTIKIIDLLNKIANGEEVPKRIKWKNNIYEYHKYYYNTYYTEDTGDCLWSGYCFRILNDEVEIIEEEKEIEKIDMSSPISVVHCAMKINELIDVVNESKGKSD